jgi:hypothetical protein
MIQKLRSLIAAITVAMIPLLGGAIPDAIGYYKDGAWPQFLAAVMGVLLAIAVVLYLFFAPQQPKTIINQSRQVRNRNDTRRGLVLLMSPLDPQSKNTNNLPSRREDNTGQIENLIRSAIDSNNATLLDLEHSNLVQPLRAVRAHGQNNGHLQFVWLVSTKKSTPSAHAFALSIKHHFPALEIFHADTPGFDWLEVSVESTSDAESLDRTIAVAQRVFEHSERLGLKPKDLVCDVTGGFKSMTVGITLASLHGARDLQYVGQESVAPVMTDFEVRG